MRKIMHSISKNDFSFEKKETGRKGSYLVRLNAIVKTRCDSGTEKWSALHENINRKRRIRQHRTCFHFRGNCFLKYAMDTFVTISFNGSHPAIESVTWISNWVDCFFFDKRKYAIFVGAFFQRLNNKKTASQWEVANSKCSSDMKTQFVLFLFSSERALSFYMRHSARVRESWTHLKARISLIRATTCK